MSSIGSVNDHLNHGWTIAKEAEDETLELTRRTSSILWDASKSVFYVASAPVVFLGTVAAAVSTAAFGSFCMFAGLAYQPTRRVLGPNGTYHHVAVEMTPEHRAASRETFALGYKLVTEASCDILRFNTFFRKKIAPFRSTYESKKLKDDRFSVKNRGTKTTQKISRVGQVSFKAKDRAHKVRSKPSTVRDEEE